MKPKQPKKRVVRKWKYISREKVIDLLTGPMVTLEEYAKDLFKKTK